MGAVGYKVRGARHVLRGSSQVLKGPVLIKLFSLERDTHEEMLEKLRLCYVKSFFFFEKTHEKILKKLRLRDVRTFFLEN